MHVNRDNIRRMMIAVNRIDELYYCVLRTLGVKDNTFVLFYALSDGKVYSQKQICDEWSIPRTTLNTVVQKCMKDGYIQLVASGHKEKEITLTESGKAFSKEILSPIFKAEEAAIKPLLETGIVGHLEAFTERLEKEFSQIEYK